MARRSRRRRRRIIRRVVGTAFVVGVLALVGAAAGYQDLRQIRSSLTSARVSLSAAVDDPAAFRTHEGRVAALAHLDEAVAEAEGARARLRGSKPLSLLRFVPVLRGQRNGVAQLVGDAVTGAGAGRRLVATADELSARGHLTDGTVPLDTVGSLAAAVSKAGRTISSLARPSAGLWGSLASGRHDFNTVAGPTGARLSGAGESLRASLTFMGSNGPRRYFVAVQNNDEMRDQGMVLSYAVATFDHGRLAVERHGSINDLTLAGPVDQPLDPGRQAIFGALEPTRLWQSVNAPADFTWSASTMAAMYAQKTGQTVDGVIALDVPGLAHALRATGPVSVASVAGAISADNAPTVLLKDLYDQQPGGDQRARHEVLDQVAVAIIGHLTASTQDAVALGRELGQAAAEGHFRLWSRDRIEEATFERTGLGGGPAASMADRTFHVAVENGTATKLDYFIKPSLAVTVTLTKGGAAVVRTTVTIANDAPKGAKPSYQLGPDPYGTTRTPGEYVGRVYFYAPSGALVLDGASESGLTLRGDTVRIPAGEKRALTSEAVIPHALRHGVLALRFVPQARLAPMGLTIHFDAGGRRVTGASDVTLVLATTTTQRWVVG